MRQQRETRRQGTWCVLAPALVAAFALPFGCGGHASSDSGSNSNWLVSCISDAECGEELSCLCGVCTAPCDDDGSCGQSRASCASFGQSCVNSVGYGANLCIARCGANADCTAIREELRCVSGLCREPEPIVIPPRDVKPDLPEDGEWVQRGAPATCPEFDAPLSGTGAGPWGDLTLGLGWVSYTTGSTNPEYMFITTAGSWDRGDLRVGVSISADVTSGAELTSGNGDIEVWLSRYLEGYVDQVEVEGVLRVDTYEPPDPVGAGEPVVLTGELTVDDGTWTLSVPFELSQVCGDLNVIIK